MRLLVILVRVVGVGRIGVVGRIFPFPVDFPAQTVELDEIVGMPAQFIGDHGRLGQQRRDDADEFAASLQRRGQARKISVAGEEDDVVKMRSGFKDVNDELDFHVVFDFALASGEIFPWTPCDDVVSVIIEPVGQGSQGRGFLVGIDGGVITCSNQSASCGEVVEEFPVIDVEFQDSCGGVEIRAVNEEGGSFVVAEHGFETCVLGVFKRLEIILPQRECFGKSPLVILIGIGGNRVGGDVGGVLAGLQQALKLFPSYGVELRACSSWYRTAPMGDVPQEPYVNAVASVATLLPPRELLSTLHRIEERFARHRSGEPRWGARTLDLDLLAYGDEVASDSMLLPHPGMPERAFVLGPLVEILPDWIHPVSGMRSREMFARLPERDRFSIKKIA